MRTFTLFGPDHLVALGLVAAGSYASFRAGQGPRNSLYARIGGVVFLLFALALWGWRFENGFQASTDLPLWLCDIVFLLAAFCFFQPLTTPLILVVYWGLAGTLQALVTPDLTHAFPSREYLLFFVGHAVIVVGVFFLVGRAGLAAVSGWEAPRTAFLWLLAYAIGVGLLDFAFGWNYGYLMHKPTGASVLDWFGPWPLYIVAGFAMAAALLVALRLLFARLKGPDSPPL